MQRSTVVSYAMSAALNRKPMNANRVLTPIAAQGWRVEGCDLGRCIGGHQQQNEILQCKAAAIASTRCLWKQMDAFNQVAVLPVFNRYSAPKKAATAAAWKVAEKVGKPFESNSMH
jgi:hypothetical protein